MNLLDTCQITGKPGADGWSQTRLTGIADLGQLIILASGPNSSLDGKQILSQINTAYHQLKDLSELKRIKKAVFCVADKYAIETATIVVKKDRVWMAVANKGQIKLYRNGQLLNLANSQEGQITAVSGLAQPNDRFVLATNRFFQKIPKDTLDACLKIASLSQINHILSPMVHNNKKQGRIAMAIIAIGTPSTLSPEKSFSLPSEPIKIKRKFKNQLKKLDSFVKKLPSRQPVPVTDQPQPALSISETSIKAKKNPFLSLGKNKFVKIFTKRREKVKIKHSNGSGGEQNKVMTLMAVIFLFLLGVSLTISWQKKRQKDQQKYLQIITTQAEEKLNAAWSVRELNLEKGLRLAEEAKKKSLEGLKINPHNEALKKILSQSEKIISLSGGQKIMPELFFDFKIIANNVSADQLYLDNDYLWVIDREGKRLIKLDIKNKKTQLVATGSEISQQKSVLVSGKNILFWSDEGIKKLMNDDHLKLLVKEDQKQSAAAALWGGNVYVVEQGQGILKYTNKNGSLSGSTSWLKKAVNIDWQSIVSMDIDGKIWLLDRQGKIYLFAQGLAKPFPLLSVNAQANFLAVAKSTDKLAFWDSGEKTIFVLNKSGKLLAKIPLKLEKVNGLKITNKGEIVFILTKDKVYFLNLQI